MRGGLTALAASVMLASLTIGCGGGETSRPPPATSTHADTPAPAQAQPQTDEVPPVDIVHGLAPDPWKEPAPPRLRPHPGFHTDRVIVKEIRRGRGPVVRVHDMVLVNYIEADYRTAVTFNGSWGGRPDAATGLILTPTGSTRGLLAGMKGMRPGARRQIVAPPRLGGTWTGHADWGNFIYWDVVLRKILARGCSADGKHCRSIAP